MLSSTTLPPSVKHYRGRSYLSASFAVVFAVLLFGACAQAVKTVDPEPEPSQPAPTFIGTWSTLSGWYKDNEHLGNRRHTLTFTTKKRAIEVVEHICDPDQSCPDREDWASSGTWSKTDTTITRTWLDDDELQNVVKNYYWGDEAGSVLLMNSWDNDRPEEGREFKAYTRVADPGISLTGTWTWTYTDEEEDITRVVTYTFAEDGTLTYSRLRTERNNVRLLSLIGTYTHDLEKRVVLHTITSAQRTEDGEEASTTDIHTGHTLRSAYAPASDANTIALSPFSEEQAYDRVAMDWINDIDRPFGDYGRLFQKQQ